MPLHIEYRILEDLSIGKQLTQIQYFFNNLISELIVYLELKPLYRVIIVKILNKNVFTKGEYISILDFGVERVTQNNKLTIKINETHKKFLPFILLREAYYSFIPKEANELVKICINQIIENDLNRLSRSSEWKKLIRDSLMEGEFVHTQLGKLTKFFKLKAAESFETSVQFFFKEIREKTLLSHEGNMDTFYDIIFERYVYKMSRSLFNPDIIETLRVLIHLFYKNKIYQNLSDYQALFKKFKENKQIVSGLSLRKFIENMQWINNCSPIAPSYDYNYGAIDLLPIIGIIKFNPFLERNKIKIVIEEWPFYLSPKFSENSFAIQIYLIFIIPKIYLRDFLNYFNKLEESGYIIKKELYFFSEKKSLINLNYFTDMSNIDKIIDPNNPTYKKKYEIETNIKYPTISHPPPLSIFDFIILERVRYVSVTGLTFDKRIETFNAIKDDVENELRKQTAINKKFKDSLDKILNSPKLKHKFLKFLEKNKNQGFLYSYYQLNHILNYIVLIHNVLKDHPEISNIYQLQTFLNTKVEFQNIEEHLLIQSKNIKKIIFRDFLSLYFQSKNLFREEVDKIQAYYNVMDACYNLKILDSNKVKEIVKNSNLVEEIYRTREKRYDDVFKTVSLYKITNEMIETSIDAFLNHDPPVIKPLLINTILTSTFAKYYPQLILKDTPETYEGLKKLKKYFPRMFIFKLSDFDTKRNLICLEIYSVNLKEKEILLSVLYSYFKGAILTMKRYFWRGVERATKHKPRDFYNFKNKCFFYSDDLFEQLNSYSEITLGNKLEWPEYQMNNAIQEIFLLTKQNMDILIKTVKHRISHQKIEFNLRELEDLSEFRKNLELNLIDSANFIDIKAKKFFKRYIKSIKFLPAFQKFGFSQFCLYFRPFYYRSPTFEVDFRLLFINTFQNIKYPACIEPNTPIFCKYILPLRNPNKSYLNWLIKSKKNISEYCLFYKKKFYEIIHFNRNLTKEGWSYSSIRFRSYMQDVLFNPSYEPKISGIREFDINENPGPDIYGPETQEYESLTQIYTTHAIDIKSYLGTKRYSIINNISELLQKKLIFPYITLKNLDFQEKISIILPNIEQNLNDKIIKIFNFFNVCRIYEIEGEFFIYGFEDVKSFENGILIEIWLPKCEVDEFIEVFDLLFQYFNVKHRLILSDLVSGNTLLKSIYGNLDFLNSYNPLLNLKWNEKDKIWMNHKLFNEKFEPIYPDLFPKKTNQV